MAAVLSVPRLAPAGGSPSKHRRPFPVLEHCLPRKRLEMVYQNHLSFTNRDELPRNPEGEGPGFARGIFVFHIVNHSSDIPFRRFHCVEKSPGPQSSSKRPSQSQQPGALLQACFSSFAAQPPGGHSRPLHSACSLGLTEKLSQGHSIISVAVFSAGSRDRAHL